MLYVTHADLPIDDTIKQYIYKILYLFKSNNIEAWLVGGCVRDLLLNKKPKDYDICFEAPVEDAINLFIKHRDIYTIIPTGLKHGTITIHINDTTYNFECTMLRGESTYTDGRHPDEVVFTPSLEEDLKRRDFTINSIAYNPIMKKIVALDESYLDDLKYGIIRTVGLAEERFTEDALRILRAFRFAAQLGFIIETNTYEATKVCGKLLLNISKERIRDELTKILLSNNPRYLEFIVAAGLEEFLFDGKTYITDMINCPHQNPHHYTDVFHHTLDVIERVPNIFELRWSALFHDIGKPIVKQPRPQGPEGHYVYYNHESVSTEIAVELMQKLKFSNSQICKICNFVRFHDTDLAHCKMSNFRKTLKEIGPDNFLEFMKLKEADSSAHCIILQTNYAINDITICYDRFKKVMSDPVPVLDLHSLNINGNDVMAAGYKGPDVGKVLNILLGRVLNDPELNNRESLLDILKSLEL